MPVAPVGHVHALAAHVESVGHTRPHIPQLRGSVVRFVQPALPPPQLVAPLGQLHAPAVHTPALPHELPHAPQFAVSVIRSTHLPPQIT